MPRREPVSFNLILKQGWFGRFTGSVTEDPPRGMPGSGIVAGCFSFPRIEFVKRMPIAYVGVVDGRTRPLREYIIEQGHSCEFDVPHPPLYYAGEFSSPSSAQGTWIIKAGPLKLPGNRIMEVRESKGTWQIELTPQTETAERRR